MVFALGRIDPAPAEDPGLAAIEFLRTRPVPLVVVLVVLSLLVPLARDVGGAVK